MDNFRVIVTFSEWALSGVNTFAVNLVRGLRALSVPAELLVTVDPRMPSRLQKPFPSPPDIPLQRLPVPSDAPVRRRWAALTAYLEERGPCVYVPNCDCLHSCVCPKLSNRVAVVGIVHSDDPFHYEHVGRLGRYWDAVVAGSKAIEEATARLDPTLRPRLLSIRYGTHIPEHCPERQDSRALRIVYAGRLAHLQKRVLDLPGIAAALADRGALFRLTVVGDGEDREQLLAGLGPFLADGRAEHKGVIPSEDFPGELQQHDVFLLTSDFEGMPIALLDAMGRGCVPVVTDIASGIPELVQDGVNGYRVPVGDAAGFADRLAALQRDAGLRRRLALRAHETVYNGGYRVEDMVDSYLNVFRRALRDAASGSFQRPRGRILLPPSLHWMRPTWKDYLPEPVRSVGSRCKKVLRQTWTTLQRVPRALVPGREVRQGSWRPRTNDSSRE
jgi:glycosyltransferase involved in cell wall biosynthesis